MADAVAKLLLTGFVSSNAKHVPSKYIRPVCDRPDLFDTEPNAAIPLVDLQGLTGARRSTVVKEIGLACRNDGFFQVKNQGIPKDVVDGMLRAAKDFFHLPESERLKSYSDDPKKTTRLSTSFNVKTEKVSNWRDYLRLHCYPLEDFVHEWPFNPPCFRQAVGNYCKNARELALRLPEAISESLGLESDYMEKALGKQAQHMAINYYPPCPQPELTYGLPGHKDPNAITVLQDGVSGLQVHRDGRWVAVSPDMTNIGDMVQVCFVCGQARCMSYSCPKKAQQVISTSPLWIVPKRRSLPQGRIFTLMQPDAHVSNTLLTGEVRAASLLAYALIDPGATHSFVSKNFVERCGQLEPEPLESIMEFAVPNGEILIVESVCRSCVINVEDWDMMAHLLVLSMTNFDIILGMD